MASCGGTALALTCAVPAAAQDVPVAQVEVPAARFDVNAIQVIDNTVLPPAEVEAIIYPFMGPAKTADDIEAARAALQKAYEDRGYVTVSVYIPDQSIDSGVIQLQVQAQAIGRVTAPGSGDPDRIVAQVPSIAPGSVPNFNAFQKEIIALNQRPDRSVTPEVKPGEEPGTVDVALQVEEGFPLHGTLELNNLSSPTTSDLRASASIRYDNLWGRGDSISLSAQTAPRRTSDGTVFSANYIARIGPAQAIAYYIHSDSDIAVIGGLNVIGKGDMAGLRIVIPISQAEGFSQSLTAGFDYKDFEEDVRLGADRSIAPIRYVPVTLGWRGDVSKEGAAAFLSLNATFGIRGLGDDEERFDFKRFRARPSFFYLRGESETTQDVFEILQLYARVSGQYSDAPLISNEEFSVGGSDTVRGYFESEALGDYGLASQLELRLPRLLADVGPVDTLGVHLFFDGGLAGIHDPLIGQVRTYRFGSVGGGLRLKLLTYLNGAIDAGVPLRDGPDSETGEPFTKFRIWGEF